MILIVSFALWLLCGIIKDEVVLDIGSSVFYAFYYHKNRNSEIRIIVK